MAYQIEVEKTYKSILTIMEGSEKDALRKAVQTSLSRGTVKLRRCWRVEREGVG